MSKINISVIGCGGIGRVHLAALAECSDEAVIAWTIDARAETALAAAAAYGARNCGTDYHSALGPDTDAVILCVPTYLHAEIAVAALEAGKHLFCEKPIARTLQQAQAIRSASRDSKSPTAIAFVRRFDDEWLAFRSAIQAGAIGAPVVWNDVVSFEGPGPAWYGQDELGGGPFLDGAIHTLDFALYTFGPAKSVYCAGGTRKAGNTAIDTGSATVKFVSGDVLLMAWSWGLPKGCAGARVFEFLGPEGIITWPNGVGAPPKPGAAEGEVEMRHFVIDRGSKQEAIYYPAAALQWAYERQIREYLAVTRGKALPRANVDDGYEALRLSLAIIESARTGRVIEFGEG